MIFVLILIFEILFCSNVFCAVFIPAFDMCKVKRIVDGDTFEANCRFRGSKIKIRVLGLDTYESHKNTHIRKQTNHSLSIRSIILKGQTAKQCAIEILFNKPIILILYDRRYDVYGRLLADVYLIKNHRFILFKDLMKKQCKEGVFQWQ